LNSAGLIGVGGSSTGAGGGEIRLSGVLGGSCGFVPDLDASIQSFNSNHNDSVVDASVVFMAGKSSRASLLASQHAVDDQDNNNNDTNYTGSRSSRSMPVDNSSNNNKSEKKLRRRLKKKEQSTTTKDSSSSSNDRHRKEITSETKTNVRRAKSGGLDRLNTGLSHHKMTDVVSGGAGAAGSGKRSVERAKSHNESLIVSSASKPVHSSSSAKRQERQGKSSRQKKDRHSASSANSNNNDNSNNNNIKPKHAGKSKSAHIREMSMSPKNKILQGKIGITDLGIGDDDHNHESGVQLILNDVEDMANVSVNGNAKEEVPIFWPSPVRSPKERQVQRTFSNPCPSPSIHVIVAQNAIANAKAPGIVHSPMSYGSSPSHRDGSKKFRRPSLSKRALLSRDVDDDDENYLSETCDSPQSTTLSLKKKGVERTPSSLMAGVRNHFKDNSRNNMLSKMKKTFSVSGRGKDTFKSSFDDIEIGMTTIKGYVGRNERKRMLAESASRRGQVKNALYACMSDDDDSVEISEIILADDNDDSDHDDDDEPPKRVHSLHENKKTDQSSVQSSERPTEPRRVHSLPIGIRRPSGA
jgi:hypothetical protein